MTEYVGPTTLPCKLNCAVPGGVTLAPVPKPRHEWHDVLVCINGCGRAWLVVTHRRPTVTHGPNTPRWEQIAMEGVN